MNKHQPFKTCPKCYESKPATTEYWHRNKSKPDGFQSWCKTCVLVRRNTTKPNSVWSEEYYHKNKDKRLQYQREYYHKNKEAIASRMRSYYKAHREQKNEYQQKYNKEYRQRPDVKKHKQLSKQNRRARKNNLPNTLTQSQVDRMFKYFDHKCAVCGTPQDLFIKLELDHWIPMSSDECPGTIAENMIPLCGGSEFVSHIGCNQSKQDKDAMEWLESKFEEQMAKQIHDRIAEYFDWVREQN